ncbi:MAG: ATP:cob(I)alamin adenosyltransferase, partial [Cytophagaceae bacterium]
RLIIALNDTTVQTGTGVDELVLQYINRLSDYLFVLSRKMAQELHAEEVTWQPRT